VKIALGSDHAGYALKQKIIAWLEKKKIALRDFGTYSEESCDYPDFAYPVARAVAQKRFDRGILICGSGVGVSITANRVKGVRAVNVNDLYTARQSREHGDSNILCLAGRRLAPAKALKITAAWLATPFSGDPRHLRRLKKIDR
jgi:ribose 5-phosphate isomerase B